MVDTGKAKREKRNSCNLQCIQRRKKKIEEKIVAIFSNFASVSVAAS